MSIDYDPKQLEQAADSGIKLQPSSCEILVSEIILGNAFGSQLVPDFDRFLILT